MRRKVTKTEREDVHVEDSGNQEKSSVSDDDKEDQTLDDKDEAQVNTKLKENNTEISNTSEAQVFKKPDKILPCPRCNSLETKFCYFNNYNVNQPRHFCRNCQRYWTAGGTMRKVPVGAGRRKNKQLAIQYCQLLVPRAALSPTRDEIPDIASQHILSHDESPIALKPLSGNEKFLKFGLEEPLCESMETVTLRDQHRCADIGSMGENKEEPSQCGSSMTTSSVHEDETHERVAGDEQGGLSASCKILMPQHGLPCYPIPQWATPWNPCWNSTSSVLAAQFSSEPTHDSDDSKSNQINWCSPPVMAVPGISATSMPMQFVPAPYWGLSYWPVGTRNIPLAESSNKFHTIAKHSRDEDSMEAATPKKRVIVPKTLRVNDPNDALKSTVWEALGIKPRVAKPLETGTTSNDYPLNAPPELEANPAALCRSQTFQEST